MLHETMQLHFRLKDSVHTLPAIGSWEERQLFFILLGVVLCCQGLQKNLRLFNFQERTSNILTSIQACARWYMIRMSCPRGMDTMYP